MDNFSAARMEVMERQKVLQEESIKAVKEKGRAEKARKMAETLRAQYYRLKVFRLQQEFGLGGGEVPKLELSDSDTYGLFILGSCIFAVVLR